MIGERKKIHFYKNSIKTFDSLYPVTSNQRRGGEGETSARVYGIITGETRPLLPRKSLTSHRCKRREHASPVRAIKITREESTTWVGGGGGGGGRRRRRRGGRRIRRRGEKRRSDRRSRMGGPLCVPTVCVDVKAHYVKRRSCVGYWHFTDITDPCAAWRTLHHSPFNIPSDLFLDFRAPVHLQQVLEGRFQV